MPRLVILGGSVVGSVAALLFARSGWQVTVVDPELELFGGPAPELTPRPGAPHTVQAHGFLCRAHHELATRLPDVLDALLDAGATLVSLPELSPPALYDGGRPGDDSLMSLRVRRITLDRVLAAATGREPGVTQVTGRAAGLLVDASGAIPRATGVGLADGTSLDADLVVDAGGRRSPVARWLAEAGHPVVEQTDPCGTKYYTRHFRFDPAQAPPLNRGFLETHEFSSFVQLLFLGDGGTAMLALTVHGDDPLFRLTRHESVYTAVVGAIPGLRPWREVLEPTSPVFAFGGMDNRIRSLVREGRPVMLGLHQVGDSLALTNPTRGRGVSMGLAAAGVLHDLVSVGGADDSGALAFESWRAAALATYYRETATTDAALGARLRASFEGGAPLANAPGIELPADHPLGPAQLERACWADPDLYRCLLRANMALDDDREVASPQVTERARRVLADLPPAEPAGPPPRDGLHDRAVLEELLLTAP